MQTASRPEALKSQRLCHWCPPLPHGGWVPCHAVGANYLIAFVPGVEKNKASTSELELAPGTDDPV